MSTVLESTAAASLVRERYGFPCVASPLPSYSDENHKIDAGAQGRFILRLAHPQEDLAVLAFQHTVLDHLAAKGVTAPRVIPDREGRSIGQLGTRAVRLHSWIDGVPLATVERPPALQRGLGRLLAELHRALADLETPAPPRSFIWDLLQSSTLRAQIPALPAGVRRARVHGILDHFEATVLPHLETLECGVLHNDANPHNVLVRSGRRPEITGLTDFGDTLRGPWIFDAAIAAAYALLPPWSESPTEGAAALIAGYHAVRPLTAQERLFLPALIETRLAVSVVSAARARALDPSNAYISVDEAPAWRLLDRLQDEGHGPLQQALSPWT